MNDRSHSPPESWVPKIKRRRRFSTEETKILEKEYFKNSSPNQEKIQLIANSISTPRKIVTTWFQNRRAKNKRKERAKEQVIRLDDEEEEGERDETVSETNEASSEYQLQYTELHSLEESMDVSLYTGTLTTTPTENYYNARSRSHLTIDTNQPYVFPTQPNQYFTLPTTNQQYSINIYNNMNNYMQASDYYDARHLRNDTIDVSSQQMWFDCIYPQVNRSFINPTIPGQPQFYINPNDTYLSHPDKDH